jgi:hypothetical protein
VSWPLNLPVRARDVPLGELAIDAHVLEDPEERAVVREIVVSAALEGVSE